MAVEVVQPREAVALVRVAEALGRAGRAVLAVDRSPSVDAALGQYGAAVGPAALRAPRCVLPDREGRAALASPTAVALALVAITVTGRRLNAARAPVRRRAALSKANLVVVAAGEVAAVPSPRQAPRVPPSGAS